MARALLLTLSLLAAGCSQVVHYTDELVDARTGRTLLVRAPATFGGVVGFVVGLPVDLAALPVTFPVYISQPEETRDPLSIFLFPSFVLWRAGVLVAVPFDAVEFACYRAWVGPEPLTPEERERRELQLDEQELPDYPVEPIYPTRRPAGGRS